MDPTTAAVKASPATAFLPLADAAAACGVGCLKMRELAIDRGEFTVSRDGVGRGFRVKVRRDECDVYAGHNERYPAGGLDAVRKFRRQKGRC